MRYAYSLLFVLLLTLAAAQVSASETQGYCLQENGVCSDLRPDGTCAEGEVLVGAEDLSCDIGSCVYDDGTCSENTRAACDSEGGSFTRGVACSEREEDAETTPGEEPSETYKNLCEDPNNNNINPGSPCSLSGKSGVYSGSCVCRTTDELYGEEFEGVCTPGSCSEFSCLFANNQDNKIQSFSVHPLPGVKNVLLQANVNHCSGAEISSAGVHFKSLDTDTEPFEELEVTEQGELVAQQETSTFFEPGIEYEAVLVVTMTQGGESLDVKSKPYKFSIGEEVCFDRPRNYCDGNKPINCNEKNERVGTDACTGDNNVCRIHSSSNGDKATCGPTIECDRCNLAYNSFGELGLPILDVGFPGFNQRSCALLYRPLDLGSEGSVGACYLDQTLSAQQEALSCGEVSVCGNYNTQQACEANMCQVSSGCEWSNNFCQPQQPEEEDAPPVNECSLLSEDTCSKAPGCFFADETCFSEPFCEIYETQYACEGGNTWEMNSTTFEVYENASNDHELTKCRWDQQANTCVKDSKNTGDLDATSPDHKSPRTTLVHDFSQGVLAKTNIRYAIDDHGRSHEGMTFFVETFLLEEGDVCEPTEGISYEVHSPIRGVIELRNLAPGEHCMLYYAQDRNSNLEPIQTQTFTVVDDTFEIQKEEQITGFNLRERFANVTLKWNTTIHAVCELRVDGETPLPATTWSGKEFAYKFNEISTTKRVEINCKNEQHDLRDDETFDVQIHFDDPVGYVLPASLQVQQPGEIEVAARAIQQEDTICQYQHPTNGWSDLSATGQTTTRVGIEYYTFAATPEFSEAGIFDVAFRCNIGDELLDGPSTTILIDDQPPTIQILHEEQEVSDGERIEQASAQVLITCEDEPLTRAGDDANYGGQIDRLELTTGEQKRGISSGSEHTLEEGSYTVTCTDIAGNEQTHAFSIQERDLSGPERPEFSTT